MIQKATTKKVTIEFIQFNNNAQEIIEWTKASETEAYTQGYDKVNGEDVPKLYIKTLEGVMKVPHLGCVIRGLKGEHYPCEIDIFRLKYDIQEEGTDNKEDNSKELAAKKALTSLYLAVDGVIADDVNKTVTDYIIELKLNQKN